MLTYNENVNRQDPWILFWKILEIACLIGVLLFAFTDGPLIDRLEHDYPTLASVAMWVVGMLSYHQDAKRHDPWWAILSQTLAVVCLIAVVVFGFTNGSWLNFVIVPPLAWLHVQFTKRWWIRPGAWWGRDAARLSGPSAFRDWEVWFPLAGGPPILCYTNTLGFPRPSFFEGQGPGFVRGAASERPVVEYGS